MGKELSFRYNIYVFVTLCRRPLIFQTMFFFNHSLCLKYQRFTQSGGKDIEMTKFEYVSKTQFL